MISVNKLLAQCVGNGLAAADR